MHSKKLSSNSLILLQIIPLQTNSIRPFLSRLAHIYPIYSRLEQDSLEVNFVLFEDLLLYYVHYLCSSNLSKDCLYIFSYPLVIARSSHQRCSMKKGVLRNFTKFTGKHLCRSLFFNKVATLLKKRLWHRCFPVNFAKFFRTPFLQNASGWLLLNLSKFTTQIFLVDIVCAFLKNVI